jgi:hypothetical protein
MCKSRYGDSIFVSQGLRFVLDFPESDPVDRISSTQQYLTRSVPQADRTPPEGKSLRRGTVTYGYFNPATGEITMDIEKAKNAFMDIAPELDWSNSHLVTGFVHCHEIFHQLVSLTGIALAEEEECRLADIFARRVLGLNLVQSDEELLNAFAGQRMDERIRKQLTFPYYRKELPQEGETDFWLNLHRLGINIYNIRAKTIEDIPRRKKAMYYIAEELGKLLEEITTIRELSEVWNLSLERAEEWIAILRRDLWDDNESGQFLATLEVASRISLAWKNALQPIKENLDTDILKRQKARREKFERLFGDRIIKGFENLAGGWARLVYLDFAIGVLLTLTKLRLIQTEELMNYYVSSWPLDQRLVRLYRSSTEAFNEITHSYLSYLLRQDLTEHQVKTIKGSIDSWIEEIQGVKDEIPKFRQLNPIKSRLISDDGILSRAQRNLKILRETFTNFDSRTTDDIEDVPAGAKTMSRDVGEAMKALPPATAVNHNQLPRSSKASLAGV